MLEIDLQSAIKTNAVKLGSFTTEAYNDRMIVIEDEFRSGYECTTCLGSGKVKCYPCSGSGTTACSNCNGTGESSIVPGAKCTQCKGDKLQPCLYCAGSMVDICPGCGGKGGLLVVPEASVRRPTTGVVVSLGWKLNSFMSRFWAFFMGKRILSRGQSVMYTSFSGHTYDLEMPDGSKIVIRILQESDILTTVEGHLELRRVKKSAALGSAA